MTDNDPRESDTSSANSGLTENELREHGIEEAKRVRDDVPGDTEHLRTQRAILDRDREVSGFTLEKQQTENKIEELSETVGDTRETLRRLRNIDDDTPMFERLPDGTLVDVTNDKEAFEQRLTSQLGDAQSQLDAKQDRLDAVERGLSINQLAIEWLEGQLQQLTVSDGDRSRTERGE